MSQAANKAVFLSNAVRVAPQSTQTALGLKESRGRVCPMVKPDIELQRERVQAWARADAELTALRRDEIRRSGMAGIRAVIPTADLLRRLGVEPSPETGLIEQQAWFAKLRHA
jgi:hypothetical protein